MEFDTSFVPTISTSIYVYFIGPFDYKLTQEYLLLLRPRRS